MQLKLAQTCLIDSRPELIRSYLADYNYWPKIFNKIKTIESEEQYCSGTLEFRGKVFEFVGERVVNMPSQVVYKLIVLNLKSEELSLTISYDLSPKANKTWVRESIQYERDLPWFIVLITQYLKKFGHATDRTNLERLESLCLQGPPVLRAENYVLEGLE